MPVDMPSAYKEMREEWVADTIGTAGNGVAWLTTGDTGDTVFARAAARGSLTAQGATAATDDNMVEIGQDLLWMRGQDGDMWVEARVQFDVVTNVAFNFGLNDDASEDSNTLPIEIATALTTNASTSAVIVFDVDTAAPDVVRGTYVDDDSDDGASLADMRLIGNGGGFTPTAARWFTMRVETHDRGTGNGLRIVYSVTDDSTGIRYERVVNSTVDRDALLTPYFAFENRSATAHVADVEYFYWGKSRP